MNAEVSVVVAVKNEQKYIREAVDSILRQEGVLLEVIVVDDGSEDDTFKILSSIKNRALQIYRNPGEGKVSAYNYAVSRARGSWVCLFAGDDIMPPGSLAARLRVVADVQSTRPVVGLSRLIQMSEIKAQNGIIVPKNPNRGGLTGTSYLMDRFAVGKFFPVPEELPNEDTWLETCVLHFEVEAVHSGIIGNQWRVHAGNSVNMLVPFREYNSKITCRMRAFSLFKQLHGYGLTAESLRQLETKIACEEARKNGRVLGVMTSGASLVGMLRALSATNAMLYEIRRRLYGLLSGW